MASTLCAQASAAQAAEAYMPERNTAFTNGRDDLVKKRSAQPVGTLVDQLGTSP
jgi:hypothetical protein